MDRVIQNFRAAHPIKKGIIILWMCLFVTGVCSLFFFSHQDIKTFILGILGNQFSLETVFIFWGLFIIRIIVFLPMSVLLILAPFVFGNIWLGILFSGLGQIIGASTSFFLARYYGQEFLENNQSKTMKVVNHKLEQYGMLSIILLRVIPIFPYDIINFSSGLSRMKFSRFFFATALSVWPDCVLYGLLGGSFQNPKTIIFAVSFGLIIFGVLWYLKTHPHFKDFFVMKIKEKIRQTRKKINKRVSKKLNRGKKRF